jgi:NAD(P)-dependent dehydrogenase (short-subunit alcohol dehydrogenase family)
MKLEGALAVVTGGATGIGRATIDEIARRGGRAVSWDLHGDSIRCDVREWESIQAAMAQTVAEHGVPSVLVTSAGLARMGTIADIPIEDWDLTYAVNVRGVFLSMRAFIQEATAAGLGGSIVLVSSVNAFISDPGHSSYSSSKAALAHLARCAAVELGHQGIRVNAVAPGPTATPMMETILAIPGYPEKIAQTTPLGRVGEPADIAQGIANIVESDWMTGQVIALDGGTSLVTARGAERARGLAST